MVVCGEGELGTVVFQASAGDEGDFQTFLQLNKMETSLISSALLFPNI